MTTFNLIIDTQQELTPGDIAAILKRTHEKVIGCETEGALYDENGNRVGNWNYETDYSSSSL